MWCYFLNVILAVSIRQRPNTLDLHGFYVNEALKALQEVLQVTPKGQSFLSCCRAYEMGECSKATSLLGMVGPAEVKNISMGRV